MPAHRLIKLPDAERLSHQIVPWLVRRRRAILIAALAVTCISSVFAARLYGDLRSGIEELLPESAPSVVAARSLGGKLHSFVRLVVVLEGDDGDAVARFADALAPRLRALPPALVESVDYQTTEQDRFARQFGGLYLSEEKLRTLRDQLAARVAWEKRQANPLLVGLDDEAEQRPEVELPEAARAPAQFRDGRWQTPDGHLLVIQVMPPDSSTEAGKNRELLEAVQREVALQKAQPGASGIQIGYSGEVAELVEEQAALVADLASSTAVVLLLVVLALYLYFRRWPVLLAVFGSLAVACAVCFGLSWFLIGHLNANTAFLGSIVVGNGINVGIVFAARVLEERRRGAAMDEALRRAWSGTLAPTFVAAFGAALAYLSLASTDFRGFSQFGVIGALGMALCWLAAYLLLPPLFSALHAWRSIDAPPPRERTAILATLSRWIEARPLAWSLAVALVVAASALALARRTGPIVEVDVAQLRAKRSIESGAQHWAGKGDQVFHAHLNPIVIRATDAASLARTLDALELRRRALGAADPLGEVQSLATLAPTVAAQQPKLALLGEIRALLDDKLIARLPAGERERVLAVRPDADLRAVQPDDLPAPLRRALTERDGTTGTVALAFPKGVGRLDLAEVEQLKVLVRGAIADAGGRAQALNPLFLLSDIDESIWHDGPRATLLALGLVCLLVLAVVRRAGPSALVLASLFTGLIALVGAAAAAGVRINFLNFVVLPITFGIGVDYAVNMVQRYRQEGRGSIGRVLRETGGAVALCSATTIIGYGSLLIADNQALAGFGALAAFGEVTCLSAALIALPAWLALREQGRRPARREPASSPLGASAAVTSP